MVVRGSVCDAASWKSRIRDIGSLLDVSFQRISQILGNQRKVS
jgi:hypothetical protein